jgi:divalent metal cation (Fe/Co/Zn/Cd) transporter
MHIEVQEDLRLEKAHEISVEIEEKIRQRFKDIESVTIHVEPGHKEKQGTHSNVRGPLVTIFLIQYEHF